MASRLSTAPPPPRPPLQIHSTAIVADKAQITGSFPVTIGENAIIQPWARIRADHGSVVIGNNSTIAEKAVVGLKEASADQDGVMVGEDVSVETGAVVEAREVGQGCIVEVNAKIGKGVVLGKWSTIAPLEEVTERETINDFEVVFSNGKRRVDITVKEHVEIREARKSGHDKMMEVLRILIPDGALKWR